jgi:hypothetical protein
MCHAAKCRDLLDSFASALTGPTVEAKTDVLAHSSVREEKIMLKDHPDAAISERDIPPSI